MNDPIYINQLLKGDIHEVNRVAAGINTRSKSKTFIYSWLMGAGDEKVGLIVGVDPSEYDMLFDWYGGLKPIKKLINKLKFQKRIPDKKTVYTIIKGAYVKSKFLDSIPSLKRLKTVDIPKAARDGFLIGLDGRKIWVPNEHLAMSLHLQSFEAIIMKLAMVYYTKELKGLGIDFKQVCFIHDEFQVETKIGNGAIVGEAIRQSIIKAGEELGSNCPLDGSWSVGRSWAETH